MRAGKASCLPRGFDVYDKNNETLTVACTCLESGNAIWPTVPGDGKLTIDVRYSSEQLANTYDAFFKNLTSFNPKVRVETKGGINKPPFDKENIGNKALYKRAIEVAATLGIELKGEVVMGGSDGNFTSAVGCPTLDGLGMTGDFVHNPKEYINLDCVPPRGAMVAELALRTLKASGRELAAHSVSPGMKAAGESMPQGKGFL